MHNLKPLVVQDACILLDLLDLQLLEAFFCLDLHVLTTQFVIDEIKRPDQRARVQFFIDKRVLEVDETEALMDVLKLKSSFKALSVADCSVLEVAIRLKATILSADGGLRKIAKRENCIIHGTIWILEELCRNNHLSKEATIEHLEQYAVINIRAPIKEIKKSIAQLGRGD